MPRPLSEQVVVISVRAVPLHATHTASKFAVRAFYDCLRMELADTPFFEHARSKLGAMVKCPPPGYATEIVAAAIVPAATSPTRQVPVGGSAVGTVSGRDKQTATQS